MLKMPQFNSKMNALKEVSRLIDECDSAEAANSNFKSFGNRYRDPQLGLNVASNNTLLQLRCSCPIRRQSNNSNVDLVHIPSDRIVEWMGQNRVLSVALEGNIDQVQYTDKIKGIVEFLGVRLNLEELTRMWSLQVRAMQIVYLQNFWL